MAAGKSESKINDQRGRLQIVSSILGVSIGHQSQQMLSLTIRKIKLKNIYTLGYVNSVGAWTERAVPQSLFKQIQNDFSNLEVTILRNSMTAIGFVCTDSAKILRNKKTYSICLSLLRKNDSRRFNKWFADNRDLVLDRF